MKKEVFAKRKVIAVVVIVGVMSFLLYSDVQFYRNSPAQQTTLEESQSENASTNDNSAAVRNQMNFNNAVHQQGINALSQ